MGKNRWEINSSFNVTAADIIKAYSPPLWGRTHGHCPSSDALTHGPRSCSELVKKHRSVVVPRGAQQGLQEYMWRRKSFELRFSFMFYLCFVHVANQRTWYILHLEDCCLFLWNDLYSMRASDFGQGQTGPVGGYFDSLHPSSSLSLTICASIHMSRLKSNVKVKDWVLLLLWWCCK